MAAGKQSRARLAALVRRAQAGDEDAFAEIYQLTSQAQFYLLSQKVGIDAAKDLVQELYLIAWNNIQNIEPHALLGYLGGVGRNLIRDHLRHKSHREGELSIDHEEAVENWLNTESITDMRDPDADPADTVVDADERSRLARALSESLDDDERAAVVMRYYQGMKIDEIAEALNTSRNTVKRTLARALVTLRQNLTVLPFGFGLSGLLESTVGAHAAPLWHAASGKSSAAGVAKIVGKRGLKVATGVTAAVTVGLVVTTLGYAATTPHVQSDQTAVLPEADPVPMAEPATADQDAPQLLEVVVEGEVTILTFQDTSGVAKAWCVGADGVAYEPLAQAGVTSSGANAAHRSEWRFLLPSGTFEAIAVDNAGNAATGTITCDIVSSEPAPPQSNPFLSP